MCGRGGARAVGPLGGGNLSNSRVALVACALVALLAWLWHATSQSERAVLATPPAPDAEVASAEPVSLALTLPEVVEGDRRAANPEPQVAPLPGSLPEVAAPTTATVRVEVVDAETGAPIPAAAISTFQGRRVNPFRSRTASVTDANGVAECVMNVPAGVEGADHAIIYCALGGSERVTLSAGAVTNVRFEVEGSFLISGRVVDAEDRPVAAASIWVSESSNYTEGIVVATADARGEFRVRIGASNYFGARHPGHRPSFLLTSSGPSEGLVLRLRGPARTLLGLVVDSRGAPIEGAAIQFGMERGHIVRLPEGGQGTFPPATRTQTDAAGRFRIEDGETDSYPLLVRAEGFAPRSVAIPRLDSGNLSVPGELRIVLEAGVTIEGCVTDASGAPVEGASVGYGAYAAFLSGVTYADVDGRYRLIDVGLGDVSLRASKRDVGKAETTLSGAEGESLRWDPVLDEGGKIQGRIEDPRGAPRSGLYATARPVQDPRSPARATAETGPDGAFRIAGLVPGAYDVEVSTGSPGQVVLKVPNLQPSEEHHVWILADEAFPSARIRGSLAVARGVARELFAYHPTPHGGPMHPLRFEGEAFSGGPFLPGKWEVVTGGRGAPGQRLARFELARGEHRDLGRLVLDAPGRIEVSIGAVLAERPISVDLVPDGGTATSGTSIRVASESTAAMAIAPGRYGLWATDGDLRAACAAVDVPAGGTAHATLAFERAGTVSVQVASLVDAGDEPTEYEVRDARGHLVFRRRSGFVSDHLLPPGVYTLRARCGERLGRPREITLSAGPTPNAVALEW